MFSDPPSFIPGQKLGRYDLLAPVARDGMGQVWVARLRGARGFHKLVAIKTLLGLRGDTARVERRLLEEARIAALIQHSNVVQTLELGEHEGTLYLVMEWVEGEPLAGLIKAAKRAGGFPLLIAVNLVAQTLRGLQAAHELQDVAGESLGVVHRNVSPHSVLVTFSGVVKVADFGIAPAELAPALEDESRAVQRNIAYLAPEQIACGETSPRTDLFAIGVLLYLLTTGRHPFKNDGIQGILGAISSEEPPVRPSLIVPTYSRTLEAVVMKALEKDPARRWASAEEMRLALERGVPHAFALGFETQLRNFMTDLSGARAQSLREVLRRAELTADAYAARSLPTPDSVPAPSLGSLRAISLDSQSQEQVPELTAPSRTSRIPSLRPLLQLGSRVSLPKLLPALVASLALAALLMILLRAPRTSELSPAAASGTMADYPAASVVPTTKVVALPTPPSPSSQLGGPSSVTPTPSASVEAASALSTARKSHKKR